MHIDAPSLGVCSLDGALKDMTPDCCSYNRNKSSNVLYQTPKQLVQSTL